MLYISARLHMHAVDTSPAHNCLKTCTAVVIIWQAQNGDPIRAYRSSKTPDKYMYMYVFSVIHKARGDTQASAWSRALTTARSRAYCAITSMASNT